MTERPRRRRRKTASPGAPDPLVELRHASLAFGSRRLWNDLDLRIEPAQFIAVIGANGSGKTSLMKVLLGEQPLTSGQAVIGGQPVRRGSDLVGYVPQRVAIESAGLVRVRDLVRMGVDGHRFGPPLGFGRRARAIRERVQDLLEQVGVAPLADRPVAELSGGELQRVRIAQALACNPELLICDEPLAALDLKHQRDVAALLDRQRRDTGAAVIFVTHEINAVLHYVDQVLYLAAGRYRLGRPEEVMTSQSLSALYGAPVDVINTHGRLVVVAASDMTAGLHQSLDDHGAHADHTGGPGSAPHFHELSHPDHAPDSHDHGGHDPADQREWVRR